MGFAHSLRIRSDFNPKKKVYPFSGVPFFIVPDCTVYFVKSFAYTLSIIQLSSISSTDRPYFVKKFYDSPQSRNFMIHIQYSKSVWAVTFFVTFSISMYAQSACK